MAAESAGGNGRPNWTLIGEGKLRKGKRKKKGKEGKKKRKEEEGKKMKDEHMPWRGHIR